MSGDTRFGDVLPEDELMSDWQQQEPGWFTREGVGGICRERNGKWYIWPWEREPPSSLPHGYATLAEAMRIADRAALRGKRTNP